jgi:hypothetical protein
MGSIPKRISTPAYQALTEALAVGFWYKASLHRFVSLALREHPHLWRDIDFEGPPSKRQSATTLVDRLAAEEATCREATFLMMKELANLDSSGEFARCEDPDVREDMSFHAREELARRLDELDVVVDVTDRARQAAEEAASEAARSARRNALQEMHQRFLSMGSDSSPQSRGLRFERFLADLFDLFSLSPRLSYSLQDEQIDGSLSFDTDDYIVEAKWTAKPLSREQADAFAAKVNRKGKNALGLIVSINGISDAARRTYDHSTPFMTMDGQDLLHVLEGRLALDELLRRKKRWANDTGECYAPALTLFT